MDVHPSEACSDAWLSMHCFEARNGLSERSKRTDNTGLQMTSA